MCCAVWEARGLGRDELMDEKAVVEAVEFGIAVSGITCGRTGADPPRVDELGPDLQALLGAELARAGAQPLSGGVAPAR